jgi:hypothetical protein
MSRRALCGAAGATVLATSLFAVTPASAQVVGVDDLGTPRRSFESPQRFALEFRFGAFWPAIDTDPNLGGKTPFRDLYGNGPQLMSGAEFDWQAVRIPHLGTIGPGLAASYMKASTLAPFTKPHNGQTLSGEDTSLEIFPFYAVAVLRVDVLWRDYHVPLVPWVKAGIGLALWRASNTLGTSSFESVSGEGHSLGTHVAVGLGLNLNCFDPDTAREFDNSLGVNGTYLFAEYTREDLDGLGTQSDPLRVGGNEWTFGLALEF